MSTRRKAATPPDDSQRWLATYGDMVTLLMAFFVMLFALGSVEKEKFDAFLSGLDRFGNPAAAAIFDPVGEPIAAPVPAGTPDAASGATTDGAASGAARPDAGLERLGQQLVDAVAAAGYPGTVEIEKDERGLGVAIGTDDVLFDVGQSRVTDQGLRILDALAPPLAGVSNDILVEGHADTTPLNRGGYTNWNLSTDRAVAVVNALVGRHSIPPHRLTASGFGEFQPRDPDSAPAALARNRRVELIIRNAPVVGAPVAPPAAPASPLTDITPSFTTPVKETP